MGVPPPTCQSLTERGAAIRHRLGYRLAIHLSLTATRCGGVGQGLGDGGGITCGLRACERLGEHVGDCGAITLQGVGGGR